MKTTSQSSDDQLHIERDGNHQSAWQAETITPLMHPKIQPDLVYDTIIIGGGITGVTAALLLQNAGKRCLLIDMGRIGYGTTGGTSAHINTFADTTYTEAESAFGKEGAQLFADAINEGFAIIKNNINTYQIDCDLEVKNGYIYAEDEDQAKQLADLYNGTVNVGVDISYVNNVPTPVEYVKAVMLPNQAQFHPLKYLKGLEAAYLKAGGLIIENTRVEDIEHEYDFHLVKSSEQVFKAKKVIYATHVPPKITVFSFRCAPYRSYVLGVKLTTDSAYPDALVYDMQDPYHYFRTHVIDGQKLLIAGGNDHKTGHDDPEKAFADLEKYVRKYYKVSSVKYRWSSQYYIPVDGFPYIGQIPFEADGIYCATGFNGNGMMLGTISAKILSDIVLGIKNKYEDIFNTSRIKPIDGFAEFVKENADVAYHFIADRLSIHEIDSLKRLPNDSGKVVEVNGKKIAAYRDKDGNINALNPVCTHAACIVNWNQEEKSWDCPCHGARYDINGTVITGPAVKNLPKIDIT
jgi:glycine/D-amino acid oxidase-like deaminating enzyme/nitrite reductase/ring-hydroxylating ferredoxin subunit